MELDELNSGLADLGIDGLSQQALALVPLVEVAWADGSVSEEERRLIQSVAQDRLDLGEEGLRLLQDWLRHRPSDAYFEKARHLLFELSAGGRRKFQDVGLEQVIDLSEKVARASGGLLGFGSVSREERVRIQAITESLSQTAVQSASPATARDTAAGEAGAPLSPSRPPASPQPVNATTNNPHQRIQPPTPSAIVRCRAPDGTDHHGMLDGARPART